MSFQPQLDNFIDPASKYPTIVTTSVTTSKFMTTGVDAQTCKLIVLDSNINSMIEFKQIIGKGTSPNLTDKIFNFGVKVLKTEGRYGLNFSLLYKI